MREYLPYQMRVIEERNELRKKHDALILFISGKTFHDLNQDEAVRLSRQSELMKDYLDVLNARITAF